MSVRKYNASTKWHLFQMSSSATFRIASLCGDRFVSLPTNLAWKSQNNSFQSKRFLTRTCLFYFIKRFVYLKGRRTEKEKRDLPQMPATIRSGLDQKLPPAQPHRVRWVQVLKWSLDTPAGSWTELQYAMQATQVAV